MEQRHIFTRSPLNPILQPSGRWWESRGVFNPGAALVGGRVALVYRAVGSDGISRFGLAWSTDGERIDERLETPLYEAALDDSFGRLGVEDPRITRLDDTYYLTYCKASTESADTPLPGWETAPFRIRSALARTQDFQTVKEMGTILPQSNTKDTVLLPERIDGRYAALIREYPAIQYVTSDDLEHWSEPEVVMEPIPGTWEGERIGAGPPPVRTPWGLLFLYHGNEYLVMPGNQRFYRMGLAVLHTRTPREVLYRHPDPIFSPEEEYEIDGPVGNVVFGTGLVDHGDRYHLYYGAADGVIGVATAEKRAVFTLLQGLLGEPKERLLHIVR